MGYELHKQTIGSEFEIITMEILWKKKSQFQEN